LELRNLGKSGLAVSAVGLGCNNFGAALDLEGTRKVVHAALDHGITLFDTADLYGNRGNSEIMLGEALGVRRKDIVLATKSGKPMDDARSSRASGCVKRLNPTGSIFISCTIPTRKRRSRKRSARSTI
jgi:aryl-alcohol dehydrogenase-like predicted oxidoreductase